MVYNQGLAPGSSYREPQRSFLGYVRGWERVATGASGHHWNLASTSPWESLWFQPKPGWEQRSIDSSHH